MHSSVQQIIFSYVVPHKKDLEKHFGRKATISKPITIKSYNKTRDGSIKENGPISALQKPKFPLDLDSVKIEVIESAPPTTEFTDLLQKPLPFDFVTFRNCLNKIGNTPYEDKQSWEIDIRKEGRTIRLEIVERPPDPEYAHFMRWGYAFEVLVTDKETHGENEHVVIKDFKIGKHKIGMVCEVDCVDPENGEFVELKTNKIISHWKQEQSLIRYKMRKAWLQSYLADTPNILFGFRDDKGIVNATKRYRTNDLPKLAQKQRNSWSYAVCLNFINYILDKLKKNVKEGSTYKLVFEAQSKEVKLILESNV